MQKAICLMVLFTVTSFLAGCGNSEPQVDTTPFEKPIATYLSQKSMDMKVSTFKDVKIEGDKATAKCSMKAAAGIGPAVRWEFNFEKKDGVWKVTGHKQ